MYALAYEKPLAPMKEGISVLDWKARAVGGRSCICMEQSPNRDCDAVGIATDSIPTLGIRAEACFTPTASPFSEHIPATLSSLIGTSASVSHSRALAGSASGRGERDWLGAVYVPPAAR